MKALHARPHHVSRELVAGIAVLAVVLGLGTWLRGDVLPRTDIPRVESRDRVPIAVPLQVYWLTAAGNEIALAPMPLDISPTATAEQALTAAMTTLLQGPIHAEDDRAIAAIPLGTELLNLQVRSEGVYVDLSDKFAGGGGSTSMVYRVAQVLYTATSLDPDTDVYLSIEGQPLDKDMPLGGEGLLLESPLRRSEFARTYLFSFDVSEDVS
ncbi:MAG: GerMN domain-containing protein [Cyanobacteria bacterium J06648_11]